ncbi:hypothetical protein J4458_05625 [Candidatus Woesearchaeota archaeon]|nr:hypothetical protein [Candidatus Woesearchaeota archaeon]
MGTLYLLGTVHGTRKSKKRLTSFLTNNKVDIILAEGIRNHNLLNKNYWKIEPFLLLVVKVYFYCLKVKGTELNLAEILAKNKGIKFVNMDMSLSQVIDTFHKKSNLLVFLFIFIMAFIITLFNKGYIPLFLKFIIAFVFAEIGYLGYFAISVNNLRNKNFKVNIISNLKNDKEILVVCGKFHSKFISKNFNVAKVK